MTNFRNTPRGNFYRAESLYIRRIIGPKLERDIIFLALGSRTRNRPDRTDGQKTQAPNQQALNDDIIIVIR